MKAKDVRFKIKIHYSETQLSTNFFRWHLVIIVLKKYTVFKENCFYLKLFLISSFKNDSITMDPDPDPNWAKILDPDPNSMYLDPQHWLYHSTVDC